MTPHKHATLIHAWADGAEIQYKYCSDKEWKEVSFDGCLSWDEHCNYRIKPNVIRYKRYLVQYNGGHFGINTLMSWETSGPSTSPSFIKWIDTEWQEVEA